MVRVNNNRYCAGYEFVSLELVIYSMSEFNQVKFMVVH